MPASFPTSIFVPRATQNLPGVVYDSADQYNIFSEDYQIPNAEIVSIETILGLNPEGSAATVVARLNASDTLLATLFSASTINPGHEHSFLSASDGNPSHAIDVDANGNIGIGTTSQAAKLDIVDTILSGSGSLFGPILKLTQTWNTSGSPTSILLNVINTLSGGSAKLIDLQVGGASKFAITAAGGLSCAGGINTGSTIISGTSVVAGAVSNITFNGRNSMNSPVNGQQNFTNSAQTSGFGIDVTTDGVVAFRTRAQTADANATLGSGAFSGNIGIGLSLASITAKLDINSDTFRLRTSKTPATSSAAGDAGAHCWDSSFLYVCVATNTWKRIALLTF